jgi:isoamylase
MEIWPGSPFPPGAAWDGGGTNFSLFSENADAVELCLFDDSGGEARVRLPETTAHRWHGYVPGIGPGQRYGYRVHGPWKPQGGLRFSPSKLLLDPYSLAIDGDVDWGPEVFAYRMGEDDLSFDDRDDAARMPKSVVVDGSFYWGDDAPLRTPWHDTVIYETHVKGFTITHEGIPEKIRGTYAGLAHDAAVEHLHLLGVTAVELLPIHHFVHPRLLVEKGLRNYWGYDSIGYLAPYSGYSSSGTRGEQVAEFKEMVKSLHEAGIEVILDVVYNHTAEGNHLGPTLSFKGVDNSVYYRLVPGEPRFYFDTTGTGKIGRAHV